MSRSKRSPLQFSFEMPSIPQDTPSAISSPEFIAQKRSTAKTRLGKQAVTFYMRKEGHKQVKLLSLQKEISAQDLIVEALNDYFQKNGMGRIG